jgi:hypothetical protein
MKCPLCSLQDRLSLRAETLYYRRYHKAHTQMYYYYTKHTTNDTAYKHKSKL